MPREQNSRIQQLDPRDSILRNTDGPRAVTEVKASPNAVAVQVGGDTEVEGLLRGLAVINPRLNAHFAVEEEKERDAGRNASKAGMGKEDAQGRSKSFLEGYLDGSGEAAAVLDATEAQGRYAAEVDKNGGDVEGFLRETYESKMKGVTDPVFKAGYDRVFAHAAQKLRETHGENVAASVVDTARANAQQRIDFYARQQMANGKPLDAGFMQVVGTISQEARLSTRESQESLFLTLKKIADDGNPEVWDLTRLPATDPRTGKSGAGMYSIPDWKQKIDAAEAHAKALQSDRSTKADAAATKARKNRQMETLMPVFDLIMAGDEEGANTEMLRLSSDRSLFPRMDELHAARNLMKSAASDFERPGEERLQNQYLLKIYGEPGPKLLQEITSDPGLSFKAKKSLYSEFRAEMGRQRAESSAARTAAASERTAAAANANAWARNPEFKADLDLLNSILKPKKGLLDSFDQSDVAKENLAAQAEREFISWQALNPDADSTARREKVRQIIKNTQDAVNLLPAAIPPTGGVADVLGRTGVPYKTHAELLRAHKRGDVDPDTFMHYSAILKGARGTQEK